MSEPAAAPPAVSAPPGLRPGTDADAEALAALVAGCWAAYEGCVYDEVEMAHLRAPASHFAGRGGRLYVVEAGGEVVASVAWDPAGPGQVELHLLYVRADARRRGLAAGLVDLVEAEARRRGATGVGLWSDTRFADAHRLYERLGYRRGGTRQLHDRSHSVEYRFEKELAPAGSAAGPG